MLAHGGIACIDEIEKMDETERSAILEALEQGTVSIAKADIHALLETDVCVLAAANPEDSSFDRTRSAASQVTLSDSLLSRCVFYVLCSCVRPGMCSCELEPVAPLGARAGRSVRPKTKANKSGTTS